MAIRMQGAWTVCVKSRNGAFPQRFIIQGADTGNGTYKGDSETPSVSVTGREWNIRVQGHTRSGWLDSRDQITFISVSPGLYKFDIQTNDPYCHDAFDHLILTCSMPVTATDFLIYGHVSSHQGFSILNRCFPNCIVIDSGIALHEALKYPVLNEIITKLYPERVKPEVLQSAEQPHFTPMIIALDGNTAIPPKKILNMNLRQLDGRAVRNLVDSVAVASLGARLGLNCTVEALAGVPLRFQEYTRSGEESLGGPYNGTGSRRDLGWTIADWNGNYIFRFSRSVSDIQSAPDVIAQLVDRGNPNRVLWESAPYFNTPSFKRMNVCIPKARLSLSYCFEGQIVQALQKIRIIS